MKYDQSLGKYVYYQYDQMMADQVTGEPEAFENVIVMFASIEGVPYHKAVYQQADFLAGGTGYYACGGKLIPITWSCDSDTTPFRFTTENGEVLEMGQGNSYIAITTPGSNVTWTQAEAPVETTAETTAETAAEG